MLHRGLVLALTLALLMVSSEANSTYTLVDEEMLKDNKVRPLPLLADMIEFTYGPAYPRSYKSAPKEMISRFANATTVSQIVNIYSNHFKDYLDISDSDYERYNSLVRTRDANEAWQTYEYLLLSRGQVRPEVTRILTSVIDQNIPDRTIQVLVRKVLKCRKGGVFATFKSPEPKRVLRNSFLQSFKAFAAACSDQSKIQILAFHAQKLGYYKDPFISSRYKKFVKKVIQRWLAAFFVSRFSGPPVMVEGEEEKSSLGFFASHGSSGDSDSNFCANS